MSGFMGSGKEAERTNIEFRRVGLAGSGAMTTQERKVDIDGEGMVAFGADRRGQMTRLIEESGLRRRCLLYTSPSPRDV
jgi:hypothetical protein